MISESDESIAVMGRVQAAPELECVDRKKTTQERRSKRHMDRPAPGFGPLLGYLGYQIRQAQAAVFRNLTAATADLKVTPGEYSLLTMIGANPGISQIDLAAIHKLDKSTLSLAVTRLAKRGLIRRARSLEDDRTNRLFLCKLGQRLVQSMRDRIEAQEKTIASALQPGERKLMLDALQRIVRALEN